MKIHISLTEDDLDRLDMIVVDSEERFATATRSSVVRRLIAEEAMRLHEKKKKARRKR